MDENRYRPPLVIELLRNFAVIFSSAIIAMSLAGSLVSRFDPDYMASSTLFAPGNGLSYFSIFQIACYALIMAVITVCLFSEKYAVEMRFIHRMFLLFFSAFIVAYVFSLVFKWFPLDEPRAWIGFGLSFIVCFAISSGLTLLKLKLEKKKYGKLLANYKIHQNRETD